MWDLLGIGLGFGSTIIGKKAAMLCTASVEEVIDKHYLDQINQLGSDEKELKEKIKKFRKDELHHKDIAYEKGATKKGLYSLMDKIIKTGSKIAINISEKFRFSSLVQHPNTNNPSSSYEENLVENFFHFYVDLQLMVYRDIDLTSCLKI